MNIYIAVDIISKRTSDVMNEEQLKSWLINIENTTYMHDLDMKETGEIIIPETLIIYKLDSSNIIKPKLSKVKEKEIIEVDKIKVEL